MNTREVIQIDLEGKVEITPDGDLITIDNIIEMLITTRDNFCEGLTLLEIWEQERPYIIKFGMTAFDCGYCGKRL